jgi:hypothetical protein
MPHAAPRRATVAGLALVLTALSVLAAGAAPAAAQGWSCEASAIGLRLGPSPREDPVTANQGQPTCQAAAAGGNPPASPLPVTGSLLSATTDLQPRSGDPAAQTASAAGGLGELRIAGVPIPLERPDTSALPGPQPIPGGGTIDVRAAVEALVPARFDAELLHLRALRAEVTGRCVDGAPRLSGTSSVLGISVLGTELPVDRPVARSVTVADSSSIDPSNLTPEQLGVPGVSPEVLRPILEPLPTIAIPATLARVVATPGNRIEGGGRLTQHALELAVMVGGQNVVDLVVGSATVGSAEVRCGGVADLALDCTSRRLVLIDVLRSKGRVRLLGAAHRMYAGRRVAIRFTAAGKVVARPLVTNGGLFRATARLPRRGLRATNRARYQASIGGEKSLRLKLMRRMLVSSTRAHGERVTIAGRVVRPLGSPVQTVVVKRRVSCGRYQVVKRFKPPASGRFRITVPGPGDSQAAVFRMQTRVRKVTSNPKLYPTFTLPRFVDLT